MVKQNKWVSNKVSYNLRHSITEGIIKWRQSVGLQTIRCQTVSAPKRIGAETSALKLLGDKMYRRHKVGAKTSTILPCSPEEVLR